MASVMPPQGLAPSVPSTRQDVISELLDGYTYDESEVSPSTPVSAFKELPQPPPQQPSNQRDRKQEAIERMNTQFQLRGKPLLFKPSLHVVQWRSWWIFSARRRE
jgi:hypothetical protein